MCHITVIGQHEIIDDGKGLNVWEPATNKVLLVEGKDYKDLKKLLKNKVELLAALKQLGFKNRDWI
jgi:hypothetical protein